MEASNRSHSANVFCSLDSPRLSACRTKSPLLCTAPADLRHLKVRLRSPQLTSRLSSPRGGRSPHRRRVVMPKLMISVLVSALSALAGAGVERFLIGRVLRFRGLSWSALKGPTPKERLAGATDEAILLCPICGSADTVLVIVGGEMRMFCCYCRRTSETLLSLL